nr:ATP-dependent Clp protease proteolytic subunit-related protein 3, chloroplastic [Ipomoea batatas]
MQIYTIAIGAAVGQACLLLAAGTKGKRFMLPNAKALIQQPRVPSSGLMQASDVSIWAKEVSGELPCLHTHLSCFILY